MIFYDKFFLLSIILLFYFQNVQAQFYENHAEGWHWYKNYIEEEDAPKIQESKDPVVQMKAVRATIERALDTAILYPTDANVRNYITLQNRLSNQASIFSGVWQKVLLENPNLDYSLVHPTNTLARRVDLDNQYKLEEEAIAKLAKEGGLFFFYSSSCVYCRKFAPMLKSFSTKYKISIIPITLDGGFLPEFPDSKTDKGQAARFNITVEPSLYAVNPYTGKAYPISHGMISEYDLRKRILDISQNFTGGT
jgi:conjugal transfer pilus assembly protein TraF